jgi:hypothetical protein
MIVDRVADRAYTDEELDAAVSAIADPDRLRTAQELVLRTAPGLQRLLSTALDEGGWFDLGHDQAVREVASRDDPGQRLRELRTLLAEETRLGMLVGVAVGFELAHELDERCVDEPLPASPVGTDDIKSNKED